MSRRKLLQSVPAALLLEALWTTTAAETATPGLKKEPKSFVAVVKRRAMIRVYKSEPVPAEKIQRLLEYAVHAPSAGNLQPWEFIVVKDPEVRAKLAKAAGNQTS